MYLIRKVSLINMATLSNGGNHLYTHEQKKEIETLETINDMLRNALREKL